MGPCSTNDVFLGILRTHPPLAWFALRCVQTGRKWKAKSPLQRIVLAVRWAELKPIIYTDRFNSFLSVLINARFNQMPDN